MVTLYSIVLAAIFLVVAFFFYKEYTNSRSYRIKKSVRTFRKLKADEERFLSKIKNEGDEIKNDEDRIMDIITKINTGVEVKIPIAAFQFIYTRLNQICVVDKNGKVQIVNSEEFKKFQETAILLLDKDKKMLQDISENTDPKLTSVFTTKKYPDGTIVKKNNVNGDITILKKDGTRYVNKNETNDLIIERPEEEDDKNFHKNKKQNGNSDDINKMRNENKNLLQENTYLKNKDAENKKDVKKTEKNEEEVSEKENKKDEIETVVVEKDDIVIPKLSLAEQEENYFKSINSDLENSSKVDIEKIRKNLLKTIKVTADKVEDDIPQKEENNFSDSEDLKTKEVENVQNKKENVPEDSDNKKIQIVKTGDAKVSTTNFESDLDSIDSVMDKYKVVQKESKKKKKPFDHEIMNEVRKLNGTETLASLIEAKKNIDMYELEKRINITQEYKYENTNKLISEIATGKNILNFILHLFHISNKRCSNFYVYEPLEKKIYVSVDMFIFKLSCYMNEEDRVQFLKDLKPSGEKSIAFKESIIADMIKKINTILVLKFGAKPFYLNEEKSSFYVNKMTQFIYGEQDKKYFKGSFLIFNIKNSFYDLLLDNKYLDKYEPYKSMFIDKAEGRLGLLFINRILEEIIEEKE